MKKFILFSITTLLMVYSCTQKPSISGKNFEIQFDQQLHSKIILHNVGKQPLMSDFQPSESLFLKTDTLKDFPLRHLKTTLFQDSLGSGKALNITGLLERDSLRIEKQLQIKIYKNFPQLAVFNIQYRNQSPKAIWVKGWQNHHYSLIPEQTASPPFWSFQAASYEERPDWVLPVERGYFRENYQGMNASDYGGGVPVVDLWRTDVGLAVGHLATRPKLVSLPVAYDSSAQGASLSITQKVDVLLPAGATLQTLPTFVLVHQGDFFNSLQTFSQIMQKRGIHFKPFPETAYQPIWCAWGYERAFTVEQIERTLPKVKELGIDWVVIDDGWQTAEGDWFLNPDKFPHGDADMRALVDQIHAMGLKAKLWFVPLAADPGTELLKQHSDWLLLNRNGSTQLISWWDSYYLCPAYPPVQEYFKKMITKILKDWDFDGLKLDGQHQNAVPPCYNPAHYHQRPEQAVEALPDFFELLYQTAISIKPKAVVEICPCGDAASFYNMACENQPVASDPTSSWQIRLKGKTYKALMGSNVPYYGDHVELSDGKDDFASTIGIGGVPGTKFVWPVGSYFNKETGDISLTPAKEKKWQKWLNLYRQYNLAHGTYLGNLYDLGYDRPEAHVIYKDGRWFYAFYATNFEGTVELRGLPQQGSFEVMDYEHDQDLGLINGQHPSLRVKFKKHLLLKVKPK